MLQGRLAAFLAMPHIQVSDQSGSKVVTDTKRIAPRPPNRSILSRNSMSLDGIIGDYIMGAHGQGGAPLVDRIA
jgi:hypothetical protein